MKLIVDNEKYYWTDKDGWTFKDQLSIEEAKKMGVDVGRTYHRELKFYN